MDLHKVGSFLKDHGPEILTGISVGGTVGSNILFVRAAKKEAEDGKKSHYILPAIVAGTSIGATIGSNRISNAQKASILAAGAGLATTVKLQHDKLKETMSEEDLKKFDDDCATVKSWQQYVDSGPSGMEYYIMDQFGIRFWSNERIVTGAENQLNKIYNDEKRVTLLDALELLKAMNETNRKAAMGVTYTYNFESDEPQGVIFLVNDGVYFDRTVRFIKIVKVGDPNTDTFD